MELSEKDKLKFKIMQEEIGKLTTEAMAGCGPIESTVITVAIIDMTRYLNGMPMQTKVKVTKILYDYYSRAEGILKE